ncbi:helix-turn-helix domain-containing protein [Falsiroseomonas sp. CW058]|uniref:helix-turn-helix domain-containing protein n=1 Tax=Falsiroseomonas sp. CW058 TaxID=3388664 RepID=UPI003D318803
MKQRTSAADIEVGQRVRLCRQRRGLSQSGLAERIGVSYQQLHKYETGQNRISAGRLADIASALGVTPADLFDGDHSPVEHPRFLLELSRNAARITSEHGRRVLGDMARALARDDRDR